MNPFKFKATSRDPGFLATTLRLSRSLWTRVAAAGALVLVLVAVKAAAQSGGELEKKVMNLSHVASWAVVPIMGGPDPQVKVQHVIGSGFLINDEGYFVTAAHVLEKFDARNPMGMTVGLRVPGRYSTWGETFEVVDQDSRGDVALCRIKNFESLKRMGRMKPIPGGPHVSPPLYATLELAETPVQPGQFVIVAGFPLLTELPIVQFGNVAGDKTFSLLDPLFAPDRFEVSVAVSPGNSGGPVIIVSTGRVVGMTVEGSFPGGQQVVGLGIADPAQWIQELLKKHNVHSHYEGPRALFNASRDPRK